MSTEGNALMLCFTVSRKNMLNDLLRFDVKEKSWGRLVTVYTIGLIICTHFTLNMVCFLICICEILHFQGRFKFSEC